ncbi:MAG: hypothetical protein U1A25_01685 [Candidatus Sungbacteria bacterium]|nr:hypothetical protein [bacterium]MDZ4260352.1 hypothetical protein [Candidatus Sungbacteria bacterium]
MRKYRIVALLVGFTAVIAFTLTVAAQDAPVIPDIENWGRVLETQSSLNADGPFFLKIYQNHDGNFGLVDSYRDLTSNAIIAYIKTWGFKELSDIDNAFNALLLADGTWVVGNRGEAVILIHTDIEEGILSFIVGFNGEHSWASRKIIVELPE